jgi:hypothetical protein
LDDYKKVFLSVAKAYGIEFKFADEQITNQHVLAKITNHIRSSNCSLFDITGWNPNVALELGIAVGLGSKYFILLNTKIEPHKDPPSDIKGIDRIQYISNVELEAKLKLLIKQELPEARNRSDSAFDGIKSKIVDALLDEQGLGLTKLSDAIGEDKTLVQSVARAMLATNELKTSGAKKGTVYFTADADLRKYRYK